MHGYFIRYHYQQQHYFFSFIYFTFCRIYLRINILLFQWRKYLLGWGALQFVGSLVLLVCRTFLQGVWEFIGKYAALCTLWVLCQLLVWWIYLFNFYWSFFLVFPSPCFLVLFIIVLNFVIHWTYLLIYPIFLI